MGKKRVRTEEKGPGKEVGEEPGKKGRQRRVTEGEMEEGEEWSVRMAFCAWRQSYSQWFCVEIPSGRNLTSMLTGYYNGQ